MSQVDRLREALSGRYELGRELGAGGMATVYLATDLKHRRQVAVKVLRADAGAGLESTRFLREIEIAAGLVHPHILSVHDSGESHGLLFFVMPYVDGETLRQRLARVGQLSASETVRVVREVAGALDHAHARGIVHRDIKPENILFESGHAVVTDFGVARAVTLAGDHSVTVTGVAVGTPVYMSPEQATGEHDVDSRCDVYSLGCVAFEMITGKRPFAGATVQAVIASKFAGGVPRGAGVSDLADQVLRRAMAVRREDRYASASEFATALEAAVGSQTVAARHRRPSTRNLFLGIAGLAILAAIVFIARPRVSAAATVRSLAVLPFASAGGDSAGSYVVDGIHDEVIGELGNVAALRVISRTSVMVYRNARKTIPEIARELGVDAVVEGTMYRRSDSVRLQLRLVRALPQEQQLWTHTYTEPTKNIQALNNDVARGLVDELRVALTPGETRRFAIRTGSAEGTAIDPAAYDAYLRGKNALNTRTAEGIASAESELRRAIKLQANFAAAHAALASALALANDWHYRLLNPIVVSREAIASANLALALDSASGEAYAARARVESAAHAPEELVRRDFERAIAVAPQYANARGWYAMELAWRGHAAESRAQNDTAIALDPLAPGRHMGFAISSLNTGDLETALQEVHRVVLLSPSVTLSQAYEGGALLLLGRSAECLNTPMDRAPAMRAMCLHAHGDVAAAKHIADSVSRLVSTALERGGPFTDILAMDNLALYYAYVGDVDAALTWAARETRITTATGTALWIRTKLLDAARRDPRFDRELAKIHESIWRQVSAPTEIPLPRTTSR